MQTIKGTKFFYIFDKTVQEKIKIKQNNKIIKD
jgi:hypothetical protein